MPELPEVEHLRRTLADALVGRTVTRARLIRRDVLVREGDPPGGFSRSGRRPASRRVPGAELLSGQRVTGITRHGKQLAIGADSGRVLCAHLGMSGQLIHLGRRARAANASHVHASWSLDDGSRLLHRDPRRFGGLWAFASHDALRAARWSRLGPDALTIDARALSARLARTSRAVKSALLDQSVIAGVGNIYADEALFDARLHPARPGATITSDESLRLARALRRILRDAIRAGGSTLRDYADARGDPGAFQLEHRVYARAGEPCLRCAAPLESALLAQRTTVWCPRCQASPSPHAFHTDRGSAHRDASLSLCEGEV